MGVTRLVYYAALCALGSSATVAGPLSKRERQAMLMTPQEIANQALVEGRSGLDPYLWVSTRNFLPNSGNDRWLRAKVDKSSGAVSYQVYFVVTAPEDAFWPSLSTFSSNGKLRKIEIERIDHAVSCPIRVCYITEQAIATVTRSDLELAASGATPGQDLTWEIKVFGRTQQGVTIRTFKTEIAGFLLAVDREVALLKK